MSQDNTSVTDSQIIHLNPFLFSPLSFPHPPQPSHLAESNRFLKCKGRGILLSKAKTKASSGSAPPLHTIKGSIASSLWGITMFGSCCQHMQLMKYYTMI